MEETLTSLGAEIVKSEPEMVFDIPKLTGFLGICAIFVVTAILLFILGRRNDDVGVKRRAALLFFMVAIGLACFFINGSPLKETGSTFYVIRVDDQTNLTAVSEQFEVTDTGNYPLLTVKTK